MYRADRLEAVPCQAAGMAVRRHRLGLLHETRDPRAHRVADPGHHVVPVEEDVGGPLPSGLDDERLDPSRADALVGVAEPAAGAVSDADRIFRGLEGFLGRGLRRLGDLMAPLRAEQRQADARLEAVVRVDEDRLAGPEEPRLLDRGM